MTTRASSGPYLRGTMPSHTPCCNVLVLVQGQRGVGHRVRTTDSASGGEILGGDNRAACIDSLCKECLIHELPKDGRAYVRQRKLASLLEATKLAEEFFFLREESYTSWTSKTEHGSGQQESDRTNRYPYYRGKRSGSPRQNRRDRSPVRTDGDSNKETRPDSKAAPQDSKESLKTGGNSRGQQSGKGRAAQGNNIKCFTCGEVGHKQASCPNKPARVNKVDTQVQCQLCEGWGHGAKDCPSKVNIVGL